MSKRYTRRSQRIGEPAKIGQKWTGFGEALPQRQKLILRKGKASVREKRESGDKLSGTWGKVKRVPGVPRKGKVRSVIYSRSFEVGTVQWVEGGRAGPEKGTSGKREILGQKKNFLLRKRGILSLGRGRVRERYLWQKAKRTCEKRGGQREAVGCDSDGVKWTTEQRGWILKMVASLGPRLAKRAREK